MGEKPYRSGRVHAISSEDMAGRRQEVGRSKSNDVYRPSSVAPILRWQDAQKVGNEGRQ